MVIISGRYNGHSGTVDSAVFQRTVDYPDEYAAGYHVVLDDGPWATVRLDQVEVALPENAKRPGVVED